MMPMKNTSAQTRGAVSKLLGCRRHQQCKFVEEAELTHIVCDVVDELENRAGGDKAAKGSRVPEKQKEEFVIGPALQQSASVRPRG